MKNTIISQKLTNENKEENIGRYDTNDIENFVNSKDLNYQTIDQQCYCDILLINSEGNATVFFILL